MAAFNLIFIQAVLRASLIDNTAWYSLHIWFNSAFVIRLISYWFIIVLQRYIIYYTIPSKGDINIIVLTLFSILNIIRK